MSALEFWKNKHRQYLTKDWSQLPNLFVEEVIDEIPPAAKVLDLGAGTGRDSVYMAERGASVVAADFSLFALQHFAAEAARLGIEQVTLDLNDVPYPFVDASFDVVYSHLSLHYMSCAHTAAAFAEIARVLRQHGKLYLLLNSVRDPERGTGTEVEANYYELEPGDRKRYFSTDEIPRLLGAPFRILACEFGSGTRKNTRDQYVRVVAERT